ncbi:hypothetical protein JCM8202v2_003177 [Rhodotorula sphaerocarpa]
MSVSHLPTATYGRIPTGDGDDGDDRVDLKPLPAEPRAGSSFGDAGLHSAATGTTATLGTRRPRRTRGGWPCGGCRRPHLVLAAALATVVLLSLSWRSAPPAYRARFTPASRAARVAPEWACNPFEANGRLQYDPDVRENNVWIPYDQRCQPSNYLATLAPSPAHREYHLPWFSNRTIVIHSDSIDRYHLRDFCDFVGGVQTNIGPEHPASPAMYRDPHADSARRKLEDKWNKRPAEGWELTAPWVCDVERYGTTLLNVFTFGLEGAESFFQGERWYYPPARWDDRLEHITMPLLRKLAVHYRRPQIEYPDLVVLNSGYWDLRRYTEEDFVAAGHKSRPYPEDSPVPYTPLSLERLQQWEREARSAIKLAARTFRGRKSGKARDGPTLLWRTLHHPPRHNYAPFPRVEALDSLGRKVIADLRASQDLPDPARLSPDSVSSSSADRSFFSSPFRFREGGLLSPASSSSPHAGPSAPLDPTLLSTGERTESEPLGLDRRLRIDNSGRLMLGQEHLFRDLLHPLPMPGSWLWGNVLLYE